MDSGQPQAFYFIMSFEGAVPKGKSAEVVNLCIRMNEGQGKW